MNEDMIDQRRYQNCWTRHHDWCLAFLLLILEDSASQMSGKDTDELDILHRWQYVCISRWSEMQPLRVDIAASASVTSASFIVSTSWLGERS